jgi:hypothetical protein
LNLPLAAIFETSGILEQHVQFLEGSLSSAGLQFEVIDENLGSAPPRHVAWYVRAPGWEGTIDVMEQQYPRRPAYRPAPIEIVYTLTLY